MKSKLNFKDLQRNLVAKLPSAARINRVLKYNNLFNLNGMLWILKLS